MILLLIIFFVLGMYVENHWKPRLLYVTGKLIFRTTKNSVVYDKVLF